MQKVDPDLFRRAPRCRTTPPDGYVWTPPPLNLAFLFCSRDYGQAIKVLNWAKDLGKQPNEIHLIVDEGMDCSEAVELSIKSFGKSVVHYIPKCNMPWPACNNHAFAETCKIMRGLGKPWLLWETDMIPAQPDWVARLEAEYQKAKRPFMGAWVDCFDHINGGAIYPHDVISWCPKFFSLPATSQMAFDCAIAPEIIWFSHAVNHMMPNIFYSRNNGRPAGLIPNPTLWNPRVFDWVHTHDTCIIHRDKRGDCIDFLRNKFGIRK
jgi:hypothetical protein